MKLMDMKPLDYNSVLENMVLLNIIKGGRREEKTVSEG